MSNPARQITVAAAQLGAIQLASTRPEVISRMLKLLDAAAAQKVKLVLYPELALTTFFPRHLIGDLAAVAAFFEPESADAPQAIISSPNLKPLFDRARELGVDISFGYAERFKDAAGKTTDYNTAIYYSASKNEVLAKYRKVHLPGTKAPIDKPNWDQQLEKMYFTPGDLGFRAFRAPGLTSGALKKADADKMTAGSTDGLGDPILGILICNDRRWPEGWRAYGLQGAEIILQGYNTCGYARQLPGTPTEQEGLAMFHHKLSCQSGTYQNGCFSINCAKAGVEDGSLLIGGSMIIAPSGRILAESTTTDDELVVATLDLGLCRDPKTRVFAFDRHRRPEHYSILVEQTGAKEPPFLG